jgi:hypothetical protein
MLWLLTLPFRILFGVLFAVLALPFVLLALPFALLALPFMLIRFAIKTAVAVALLPIVLLVVFVGVGIAFVALAAAILTPLLPFAFLALCVWAIVRLVSRPVARVV